MPEQPEICPNVPDVAPSYVDAPPSPKMSASPETARFDPGLEALAITGVSESRENAGEAHRAGECVPNIPDVAPHLVDAGTVVATEEPPPSPVFEAERFVSPWLYRHLVVTVLAVALLGLVIINQTISALTVAARLPAWAQYLLLVPLGMCCLALCWVAGCLIRSWFRLRAIRQVDIEAIEELRRRARTRRDGVGHFQEARDQLLTYLRRYPLAGADGRRLRQAGFSAADLEALARNRDFLLERAIDSRSWLDEFAGHFQNDLDRAASSRIRNWALKAAGCVIASPLPFLDAMLVFGISLKLVADLCVIYNVRSSRSGTLVLFNRAVIAAFIAGVAENASEAAAGELSGVGGDAVLGALGASMAGAIGAKMGEGAINAFFIQRLGKACVAMLQPLKPKK